MTTPKVAVIIVSFGHARFLRALFASLARVDYPRDSWRVMLLDNASPDETKEIAERELFSGDGRTTKSGIAAELVVSATNLGFAGGNDFCVAKALADGFDFVYLLNPDTEVEPDFLTRAVEAAADPSVGAVQSLLLMGSDKRVVNSVGNAFHYLGFGFCVGYRDLITSPAYVGLRESSPEIATASGAGLLVRASAWREVGGFDEIMFAYHDDLELSLKLRLAGWNLLLAPKSVVYHHYDFSRSVQKYFWMERNRWIVLLIFLKWRTLFLILPMAKILECGMFLFALRGGWWREKLRVYAWFLSFRNWRTIMRSRREIQRLRKLPDRDLARLMVSEISYQDIENPLLRRVGNPMMRAYWRAVRPLIRW